jgi:hypothetical protein
LTNRTKEFVVGLGALCLGDVAGIGNVEGAIGTLGTVGNTAEKLLKPETLQNLGDCMRSIAVISSDLDDIVQAAKAFPNGSTSLPTIGSISGSSKGDADASAILALNKWDNWIAEADQQMEFAIDEDIGGASEYRLALRKHAINGKTLAQAQANAVKAGQQYVQLQLDLAAAEKDIERLKALREHYHQEADKYEEAVQRFYDRQATLQVGVYIDLMKAAAAYRYYTLKEFGLRIGVGVPVAQLAEQLQRITSAVRDADENWDKDFQSKQASPPPPRPSPLPRVVGVA